MSTLCSLLIGLRLHNKLRIGMTPVPSSSREGAGPPDYSCPWFVRVNLFCCSVHLMASIPRMPPSAHFNWLDTVNKRVRSTHECLLVCTSEPLGFTRSVLYMAELGGGGARGNMEPGLENGKSQGTPSSVWNTGGVWSCLLSLTKAIYSIFKTESEQVDDLRMVVNVSFYHTL